MKDSNQTHERRPTRSLDCLGRTCMKWGANGELTSLDLNLVMARLAEVDQELSGTTDDTGTLQLSG
ncbi:MAG: hypothetical protein RLZZ106_148 [Cyanobacteriota bacterium]